MDKIIGILLFLFILPILLSVWVLLIWLLKELYNGFFWMKVYNETISN